MICKRCGYENQQVWFEPVMPSVAVAPIDGPDVPESNLVAHKRWACAKCGRYHFADGTLYSNPFAIGPKEAKE